MGGLHVQKQQLMHEIRSIGMSLQCSAGNNKEFYHLMVLQKYPCLVAIMQYNYVYSTSKSC